MLSRVFEGFIRLFVVYAFVDKKISNPFVGHRQNSFSPVQPPKIQTDPGTHRVPSLGSTPLG